MTATRASNRRISGKFQFLIALYIILTGDFPTIVQGLSAGVQGGAGSEFAMAMWTSLTANILLLAPIILFASNPLGILHPLILAVVVWPLLTEIPFVIEDYGGWLGVFAATPVQTPAIVGLPAQSASAVWTEITKVNAVSIVALLSTYVGFWAFRERRRDAIPVLLRDPRALRSIMIGLIVLSALTLFAFLSVRGGLAAHVASLGEGRFRALAGLGPVIWLTGMGTIALFIWTAARPGDAKSPVFIAALAAVSLIQFVGTGSRSSAFAVPLTAGVIWTLRTRQVPWKVALLLVPLMFAGLGLLWQVRTSVFQGSTAQEVISEASWSESFAEVQQELPRREMLRSDVPIIARGFEVTDGPLLGKSYVAAIAAILPRALWEDKPRGVGSLYAQLFTGAPSDALGIPVDPAVEAYWNFWLPGVLILPFLYGWLLHAAHQFYVRRSPSPFVTVFYVLVLTTFKIGTENLVDFQQQLLLLLICYAIVSALIMKHSYVARPRPSRLRAQPSDALAHGAP